MSARPVINESQQLLAFFDQQYRAKFNERYPVTRGKDGQLLKTLRSIYSKQRIEDFMRAFFTMPDSDEFFARAGYSIGAFYACLPKVIVWQTQGQQRAYPKALKGIAAWVDKQGN